MVHLGIILVVAVRRGEVGHGDVGRGAQGRGASGVQGHAQARAGGVHPAEVVVTVVRVQLVQDDVQRLSELFRQGGLHQALAEGGGEEEGEQEDLAKGHGDAEIGAETVETPLPPLRSDTKTPLTLTPRKSVLLHT